MNEIPGFPASSWREFQERVANHQFTVHLEYSAANRIAPNHAGVLYGFWVLLLVATPYVAVIGAVWEAFSSSRLRILLALPLVALAFVVANPLNPLRRAAEALWVAALAVLVFAVLRASPGLTWVMAAFVVTFASVRALYWSNTMALRLAALESEPLFLFLFANRFCTVRDNRAERVHAAPPRPAQGDGA